MKQSKSRNSLLILILINIVLVVAIVFFIISYNSSYEQKLNEENLRNIANLNSSSATVAATYFSSGQSRLSDIARYAEYQDFSAEDLLEYIDTSTSDEINSTYQILDNTGKGWQIELDQSNEFITVDYNINAYHQLIKIFTQSEKMYKSGYVFSAPEFTDQVTGLKSFAYCVYVRLRNNDGTYQIYTIMYLTSVNNLIDMINLKGGYSELKSMLMDTKGNYVISPKEFKGTNFFDYLYNYNNLTLDERNQIAKQVNSKDEGFLYYSNSIEEPSVFYYAKVGVDNWYCVTTIPIASFHTNKSDVQFLIVSVCILFILFIFDCGWLILMNRKLKDSMDKSKIANEAKTDFLSRMSHDMRTPMNAILGLASLMKDKTDLKEIGEDLEQITLSGHYLLNLINDTLDMSRIEAGKMELHPKPFNSRLLINNIISNAKLMASNKGVIFESEITESPVNKDCYIVVDFSRLEQVFMNLISNAVKYTPSGRKVQFFAQTESVDNTSISVKYIIKDYGIGMSEDFLPHLFEPFAQENRGYYDRQGGTGLGMSIVKQIIDIMSGKIEVESKIDRGTTITLYFTYPLYDGEIEDLNLKVQEHKLLKNKKILIVEDNSINRIIAVKMLEKKGVICYSAENGLIGCEMFSASEPGFYNAILMDMQMPVMGGLDATKIIRNMDREDAQQIPIIAMTANAFDDDVKNCIDAGMNDHLAKPFDSEKLYNTVSMHIY